MNAEVEVGRGRDGENKYGLRHSFTTTNDLT